MRTPSSYMTTRSNSQFERVRKRRTVRTYTPRKPAPAVRIWRPDLREDEAITDMLLATAGTLSRPWHFKPQKQRAFGAVLLDESHITYAQERYSEFANDPIDYTKSRLQEAMPPSLSHYLGNIAVSDVTLTGSRYKPTLALKLESATLTEEALALHEACYPPQDHIEPMIITPHIAIGYFMTPQRDVPRRVIDAVEAAAPETFNLQKARGFGITE